MTVLVDTGVVYAYYDADDRWHEASVRLLTHEAGQLVLPSPVLPEVDHLLRHRLGERACVGFYRSLVAGHYYVVDLPTGGYERVLELNERYTDLGLGFVDAAVIAIAESLGLQRIATTDRRHFPAVEAAISLQLVPAPP